MATVADILQAQGEQAARARRARGGVWAPLVQQLSNLPRQISEDRRADQREAALAAYRQSEVKLNQQRVAEGQQKLTQEQQERQLAGQLADVLQAPNVIKADGSFDLDAARATAQAKGYQGLMPGLMHYAQQHDTEIGKQLLTKAQTAEANFKAQPPPPKAPEPYTLKPGEVRFDAQGNQIASAPKPVEDKLDARPLNVQLADAVKRGDMAAATAIRQAIRDAAQAAQLPPQPSQDLVQVMGPNGSPIWMKKSDAAGQPAAQAPRAVTGQERQTLAFFNRAKDAVETITKPTASGDSLEQKIAKAGLMAQGQLQLAPNFLQSQDNQSYRQAQRAFTEARLRKESGAAIPNSEYLNDAKTYFAQPGDDTKIIEQKRKARQTVLDGLKFSAGKAYDEYYGEPNVSPARAGAADDADFDFVPGKGLVPRKK